LRLAVAIVSPISEIIRADIALTHNVLDVLAAAPPLVFAIAGATAARLGRRFGMEATIVGAVAVSAVGELARAMSGSPTAFLVWTIPIMGGAGLGNVLCPPLIKKYFPDRLGLVTSVYSGCVGFSTALPPLFVARIAAVAGWRPALGIWAVLAVAAILPWAWIIFHPDRRGHRASAVRRRLDPRQPGQAAPSPALSLWRDKLAWSMTLLFACNALIAFSLFAWLPEILRTAGATTGQAAFNLAILSLTAIPGMIIVPIIVTRMRRLWILPPIFSLGYMLGFAGLALSPLHGTLAWILLTRFGDCYFAYNITLITLRTRTVPGAGALSGFVQSMGYLMAAAGPWAIGALFTMAGTWRVPIATLLVLPPIQLVFALYAARHPALPI
jgi:CP family cyanate transporter-like MFS transporter